MDNEQMWFRPEVLALPAYVPGKKPGDSNVIKLASNETPFPTLPQVEAAIAGAVGDLNRYPDMFATDLAADLAAFHEWPDAGIVVGNGSTALIEKFLQAVVGADGEVVLPWRSFEAYPIAIQAAGGIAVKVPLTREGAHDLRGMLKAITPRTRAVLLCTPNNPTGVAMTHAELSSFLAEVPFEVPVLLDEAYVNFVDMSGAVDSMRLLKQHQNLIVLRTFSKAYGMAGLRCGYALAHQQMASGLRAIGTPFGVNALAQAAARAALGSQQLVTEQVESLLGERDRISSALAAQGWQVPASQANFLWFEFGDLSKRFEELCGEAGITVRRFGNEGVRVTIAEHEGSVRLMRALDMFRDQLREE
ncbi:MAG: histidinol-phosphate transaminase [Ancrocorticia sp.]|uniref:histidinol-phosphate transaminase n=1 Tax=Ancrocorticia sp. TaxID=2593684 RepID=UPI003F8E37DA